MTEPAGVPNVDEPSWFVRFITADLARRYAELITPAEQEEPVDD